MERLALMVPDVYASGAQLRTLQRRIKQWRSQQAKELILGQLRRAVGDSEGATAQDLSCCGSRRVADQASGVARSDELEAEQG